MELEMKHRQTLVSQLEMTIEEINTNRNHLNDSKSDDKEHFEIKCFLSQQRLETIQKALITNEIDF